MSLSPSAATGPVDLFAGLSPSSREGILRSAEAFSPSTGEQVLREGQANDRLFLITDGEFSVWRGAPGGASGLQLATLGPGDFFGDMTALGHGVVSASVMAAGPAKVLGIRLSDIADSGVREHLALNLARTLVGRLAGANETMQVRHEERLQGMRVQLSAAEFISKNLVCLSFYMLCLPVTAFILPFLPNDSLISFFFIALFAWVSWAFLTGPSTGYADYGFTLRNWHGQLGRGVLYSLPMLGAATLGKFGLAQAGVQSAQVFEPARVMNGADFEPWHWSAFLLTYVVLSFAQELVRCSIQGSLAIYLKSAGRTDSWRSLLVANMTFAATHVHLGPIFPLLAFLPGLYWGWIYQREKSYLATAVSHALVGGWVIFVLGIPY